VEERVTAVDPILSVRGLRVRLPTPAGFVTVVEGADYAVEPQQVFGIAGESGSGKTMSAMAILGLLPAGALVEGEVWYGGRDLLQLSRRRRRAIAGRELAMVFQDPMTSLHPMLTIGRQLTEHVRQHLHLGRKNANAHAVGLLEQVRIPDPQGAMKRFPHQFSGGMRQRIAIAIALACDPKVVIADEPTTALDVTVQAGILRLLDRLRRENGLSVILITHDLGVMSSIADQLTVFYAGRVVERGTREQVLKASRHPYTRGLIEALPHPEQHRATRLGDIPGTPPSPQLLPSGCAFHPRCAYAQQRCDLIVPPLVPLNGSKRMLACHVDPFRT
jgi:oligopeptide/dipeptide ABC transporter ATP-binding protein